MASMGSGKEYWKERRVFVTGATGIIGSWLVKELLRLGAYVVALVLDADPQSELYQSGDVNKISVVNRWSTCCAGAVGISYHQQTIGARC